MTDAGLCEAFLAQSPACHWIVDTGQVFRVIYGDTSTVLGKPREDLQGHTVAAALEHELAVAWSDRLDRALRGEILTLRERRGDAIWTISVFPIRLDGEIRYAGGLCRETTSRSKAEQELRHTVFGALKSQEFERNLVSRFLHDSVGQNLTALGLQLDLVRMDLESISPPTCDKIAEIQKLLEEMMEAVREYSYELNPSAVERAGLRSALDRLAVRIRPRFSGSLRMSVDPSLNLEKKIAASLYQIAQEAVENAVQHSSCSTIEIAVKSTRAGTFLEVRDNGRGFDPADLLGGGRGLGLLSMEHYAAQAGLDLAITSTREMGTTVRAAAEGV